MKRLLAFFLPFVVWAQCTGVSWGPTEALYNVIGQSAILPAIAVDPNGNAVAAWVNNTTGSTVIVQASFRPVGGSWGSIVQLSDGLGNVTLNTPAVAIDINGNAVVVWNEYVSNYIVQASVRPISTGVWISNSAFQYQDSTVPVGQLSPASVNAGGVVAAWDQSGNAVVGWSIFGGMLQATTLALQSTSPPSIYVATATQVSATGQSTSVANMAGNTNGDVLLCWINTTSTGGQIVEAAFKPNGGSWTTALSVSPTTDVAQFPTCAVDSSLNGLISWSVQNSTSQSTLRTSQKLSTQTAWQSPITVSTTASNPPLQEVGMDNSGDLSVIWIEHPTTSTVYNQVVLTATKLWSATAWTLGAFLSNPIHLVVDCLSFKVDTSNDAVGVWTYDFDTATSYAGAVAALSRPNCANGAWIFPETTLSSNGYAPSYCGVALNNSGFVIAIMGTGITSQSSNIIQTAVGSFPIQNVTGLTGRQLENNFALISEFYNILNWTPSSSPGVTGYNIFRNGQLIAVVGPKANQYQDHDQVKGKQVTYEIVAFNAMGQQSTGAYVTVE